MRPSFKTYGRQIIKNAAAFAGELKKLGFKLVSGGTGNHLMLIDLTDKNMSGLEAQNMLERAGIITSRTTIPYDPRPAYDPSGIRIGTPSVTTRGMKEKEMKMIARLIHRALTSSDTGTIIKEVKKLSEKFPIETAK